MRPPPRGLRLLALAIPLACGGEGATTREPVDTPAEHLSTDDCYFQRSIVYGILTMPDTIPRLIRFDVTLAVPARGDTVQWEAAAGLTELDDRTFGLRQRPYRLVLQYPELPQRRRGFRIRVRSGSAEGYAEGTATFTPCDSSIVTDSLRVDIVLRTTRPP